MATLRRAEDSIEIPDRLPVIALRDLVFFPYLVLPLLIGRDRSVIALGEARQNDDLVLLLTQKDPATDDPNADNLFGVGTVARIVQVTTLPDGMARVVLEGLGRARVLRLTTTTEALRASVELVTASESDTDPPTKSLQCQVNEVVRLYGEYSRLHDRIPDEVPGIPSADGDRIRLAHLISGHLLLPSVEKQELLEATDA